MSEDMQARITDIQVRYADMLMEKANVIGVGVGLAIVEGAYTQEMALVVMVTRKVPESELAPEDIVPRAIEGVRCDVQEVGTIEAY